MNKMYNTIDAFIQSYSLYCDIFIGTLNDSLINYYCTQLYVIGLIYLFLHIRYFWMKSTHLLVWVCLKK